MLDDIIDSLFDGCYRFRSWLVYGIRARIQGTLESYKPIMGLMIVGYLVGLKTSYIVLILFRKVEIPKIIEAKFGCWLDNLFNFHSYNTCICLYQ